MLIIEVIEMIYKELIQAATVAREKAYAPYSRFKVGAALLSADGQVFTGTNVENSSYGLTICAERAAVCRAVAEGQKNYSAIAVVTDLNEPASPCGACRQVLAEFSPDMKVILANTKGKVLVTSVRELLPLAFTSNHLEEPS